MDIRAMVAASRLTAEFPAPDSRPFTAAEARSAGLGPHVLRRLVDEGLLRRPVKGVYVATALGDSLALRAECLRLVVPEDAVVVDRHAGWLHGAEMVLRPGEHLELRPVSMYLPTPGRRLRNGLADSGERSFVPGDVVEVAGLQVTSPIRTAWDLGRVRWREDALSGLDAMLGLGVFTLEELVEGVGRFRGMRWVTVLRELAPLADAHSESPGESVLRLRCIDVGLVTLVTQVEVWRHGILVARLDLADEDLLLAIEYDGVEWHSSPQQQVHDQGRRDAVETCGWTVLAVGKAEVFGRHRTIDALVAGAAREARRERGRRVSW